MSVARNSSMIVLTCCRLPLVIGAKWLNGYIVSYVTTIVSSLNRHLSANELSGSKHLISSPTNAPAQVVKFGLPNTCTVLFEGLNGVMPTTVNG